MIKIRYHSLTIKESHIPGFWHWLVSTNLSSKVTVFLIMHFQQISFFPLLAAVAVEGAAVPSKSSTATSPTYTGPAEPTNWPAQNEMDVGHIKLRADTDSEKCIMTITNVFDCSGKATVAKYNTETNVCEPTGKFIL